jgi:hypothetical protein
MLVMPFGLMNAPAVFQEFMNAIFRDIIDIWVVIYMDDILVFSRRKEEHTQHVREVLSRLRKHHLFLKPQKCDFYTTSTSFIGINISPEGMSIEKERIRAVSEWPTPTTVKQLQSFLGFANFLRRWVKDFSSLAKPLTTLTRKDERWNWGKEQEEAFNAIKQGITSSPVLMHPKPEEPYYLETDASGVALGAILSQKGEDDRMHPIAFLSESFTPPQRNYDTHDKELLAIICSFEHWRLYLEGTLIPITVYTDHRNLQSWSTSQIWNKRHARWHITLSSFNYEIHYRPGKMSTKPDALSRRHDYTDEPEVPQVMVDKVKFIGFKVEITAKVMQDIREAQEEDESLQGLIRNTRNKDNLPATVRKQFHRYSWEGGLLLYDDRIYVPEDKDIRLDLLELHHDSPVAGHRGHARTLELLSRKYYWPGIKAQVNRYVDSCETCQRSKGHKQGINLKPLPIPVLPWEDIAYDFIVKLPKSSGYDSILTVIDRFS